MTDDVIDAMAAEIEQYIDEFDGTDDVPPGVRVLSGEDRLRITVTDSGQTAIMRPEQPESNEEWIATDSLCNTEDYQ